MKIPVINPQERQVATPGISGGASAVRAISNMPNVGDTVANVGQQVSASAQMLKSAFTLAEKTKAQNILAIKVGDIQVRAAADTALDNVGKYHAEVDNAVREASGSLSIPSARDSFISEATRDAGIAKIKINNDFTRRTVDQGKADFVIRGDNLKEQYLSAISPVEQQNAILSHDKLLNDGVTSGYLTREDAAKEKVDRTAKWNEALVDRDILNSPEYALEQLKAGADGAYADLPGSKRTALEKEAKATIIKNATEARRNKAIAEYQRGSDLIDMKIAGTLTIPLVRDERAKGNISAKFADDMIQGLLSPRKEVTKSATFNKISEFIVNPDNSPKDVQAELVKQNATGQLSDEDFAQLSAFNKAVNNDVVDKTFPRKNFMQAISFWSDEYAAMRPEVKARMFKSYMKKIAEGASPEVAVQEITRAEILNNHPQAASYPTEGKQTIDIWGVIKRIFPTGEDKDED